MRGRRRDDADGDKQPAPVAQNAGASVNVSADAVADSRWTALPLRLVILLFLGGSALGGACAAAFGLFEVPLP